MTAALRNVALTALLAVASAVTSGVLSRTDATVLQAAGIESQPDRGRAQGQLAAVHWSEVPMPEAAARRDCERAYRLDVVCCATRLDGETQPHGH